MAGEEYCISAGAFARMCQTTRDTLRYYEKQGILVPKPPAKITTLIFNLFPPRVYLCSPTFVGGYIVTGP